MHLSKRYGQYYLMLFKVHFDETAITGMVTSLQVNDDINTLPVSM